VDIYEPLLAALSLVAAISGVLAAEWAYRHDREDIQARRRPLPAGESDKAGHEQLHHSAEQAADEKRRRTIERTLLISGLAMILSISPELYRRFSEADIIPLLERLWPFLAVAAALTTALRLAGRPLLMPLVVALLCSTVAFYLLDIFLYPGSMYPLLWPLVLAIGGLWLVIARRRPERTQDDRTLRRVTMAVVLRATSLTSAISHLHLVRIIVFLGAVEVDLSGSTLEPDAKIQITVILGRARVVVPIGVSDRIRQMTYFGDLILEERVLPGRSKGKDS
jgi:hypothetical protein